MKKHTIKDVFIIGTGGFASEVTEYLLATNSANILGYFDKDNKDHIKYSYDAAFLGSEENYEFKGDEKVIIAIADYKIRTKVYEFLKSKNINFPIFIHSNSFISRAANIGESSIICPFVSITSNVEIGINFQANIYSYIAHDCIIGNNVTLAPSVKCNGNVIIEDNVYIGTGAIIFQGKENKPLIIGEGAVIAAGSVVTKSVPAGITVFGNPAIEFTKENKKRRS